MLLSISGNLCSANARAGGELIAGLYWLAVTQPQSVSTSNQLPASYNFRLEAVTFGPMKMVSHEEGRACMQSLE